jgi:hypothetical protein
MVINGNGQTRLLMSTYTGPEHALGITAKVDRGEGDGRIRNMKSIDSPFVEKGKLRAFFKDPLLKRLEN